MQGSIKKMRFAAVSVMPSNADRSHSVSHDEDPRAGGRVVLEILDEPVPPLGSLQ